MLLFEDDVYQNRSQCGYTPDEVWGGTNSQLALMLYIPELCPVSVVYSVVYFRGQVVCTPVQLHLFTGSTESLTNFESRHKVSHSDCRTERLGVLLPESIRPT